MSTQWYGPWPGEGPAPRFGPVDRVGVLSDVHGNVPALAAVLAELSTSRPDLVVFCGDLTWGCEPGPTIDLVRDLPAVFVRGNSERAVVEFARGTRSAERPREIWMAAQHSADAVEFLAAFPFSVIVHVRQLGPVRFCHGSPRSDTELVTPGTSEERFAAMLLDSTPPASAELAAGIAEPTIVTGHTHLQFDRIVAGRRSVNPGSVGLPYHEGRPGTAYWAILGPDVHLRQTRYDVDDAVRRGSAVGDPSAEIIEQMLRHPPTPAEIIADAESLVFSD